MKIAITYHNEEPFIGIASTLAAVGIDFVFWNAAIKPTFDMFDEIHPDILICGNEDVNEVLLRALSENQHTKLVLLSRDGSIAENTKPDAVCFMNNIKKMTDCPSMNFEPAANIAKFCNGRFVKSQESDILYMSDVDIRASLIPAVLTTLSDYRIRVVGPVVAPVPQYVGNPQLSTMCNIMKSTKVAIDFFNQHYLDYAANKVFCLSSEPNDVVPSMTLENYLDEIHKYVSSDKLRNKSIKEAYNKAIDGRTYFHRVADIFELLGIDNKEIYTTLSKVLNNV